MSLTTQIERSHQTACSATNDQYPHMVTKLEKGLADLGGLLGERFRTRPRVSHLDSVDTMNPVHVDRISNPKWKHDQLCWGAKGECFQSYKSIETQLLKELNQSRQESLCEISVSLFMIGKTPGSAKPIIIISSEDKKSREAARKAITACGILANTKFEVGVLKYVPTGPIRPVASSSSCRRYKGSFSGDSEGTMMSSPSLSSVPDPLSVYYDPRHQLRTTGMSIFVKGSANRSRKATANIVSNGVKYGYITAAHVFDQWDQDPCSIDSGEDDIGIPFDSDSDEEDGCKEQISSAKSSALESVKSIESETSNEKNALLHRPTRQTLPDEFGSPSDLALLGYTTTIGGREKSIDCAVITIDNSRLCEKLESLTASKREQTNRTASAKFKSTPVTALTTHGPVQGVLNNVPILMSLSGSNTFHSVYAFLYEGAIENGDCGSLVVDSVTRELYGMVLATSDKQRIAYIGDSNGFLNYISDKGWRLLQVDDNHTAANKSHHERIRNDTQAEPNSQNTVWNQSQPEWNFEYQRYLHTNWSPNYGHYRTHYVQGQGWVFFDWLLTGPAPNSNVEPHKARAESASYPPVNWFPVVGTYDYNQQTPNSHVERLDASYYVRGSSFYVIGKVFSVLFSEDRGSTVTPYNDSVSYVKFGEYVHSQIRRFIVVAPSHGFCYAVPIFTYSGQATRKPGVDSSAHAIAYSVDSSPSLLEGEITLEKEPIGVVMTAGVPSLSIASRIFFGIHHPIQHNVKVKDVGQVHPNHIRNLLEYWNMHRLGPK